MATVSVPGAGALTSEIPCECRVVLVDDDQGVRSALPPLLQSWGCTVVGLLDSADGLAPMLIKEKPDVLILDMHMPGRSPLHAIDDIRYRGLRTKVVVLSGVGDAPTVRACLASWAHAYVLKLDGSEALHEAILAVLGDGMYLSPGIVAALAATPDRASNPQPDSKPFS